MISWQLQFFYWPSKNRKDAKTRKSSRRNDLFLPKCASFPWNKLKCLLLLHITQQHKSNSFRVTRKQFLKFYHLNVDWSAFSRVVDPKIRHFSRSRLLSPSSPISMESVRHSLQLEHQRWKQSCLDFPAEWTSYRRINELHVLFQKQTSR